MSIMHPGIYAFAKGKTKTIVPLNSVQSCSIAAYPTTLDLFHINIMYCEGTHTTNYIHVHTCMFARSSERNLNSNKGPFTLHTQCAFIQFNVHSSRSRKKWIGPNWIQTGLLPIHQEVVSTQFEVYSHLQSRNIQVICTMINQ